MSAIPSLPATLPEPVAYALLRAAEVTSGAEIGFCLFSDILAEMHKAAEAGKPAEAGDVAAWREQIEWLLEHLSRDLDALRGDVLATGVKRGRAGGP